jgi:metallophosphoesterase (TIGR00282 family)
MQTLKGLMTKLLFIGDIVGEPGLQFLETNLPGLIGTYSADFVIANAENLHLEDHPNGPCGMTKPELARLFAAGVQLVTGGNHSWDGPEGTTVHDDPRVLRPLNIGSSWPGRGAGIVTSRAGLRLGVVNLAGRGAIPAVSDPLPALEAQLQSWGVGTNISPVDAVLVDHHGESVFEKVTLAHAFSGRIAALVGTHTHVPTMDAGLLPGGVAFVSDVGMTGPGGGAQGYDPTSFVQNMRFPGDAHASMRLASGAVELGVVLIQLEGSRAVGIERLTLQPSTAQQTAVPELMR